MTPMPERAGPQARARATGLAQEREPVMGRRGGSGARKAPRPGPGPGGDAAQGGRGPRLLAGWILAGCVVAWAAPAISAGPATDAIRGTINEVIRLLEDPELKKPGRAEGRRRLLEKVIGERFTYEEMSRRALGAPWNKLSEAERQEFVDLFKRLLSSSYVDKIEGYAGEQVHYLNERLDEGYAEVRTKVASGKAEIPLDYRMQNRAGDWRVYDIVVDGVSLVNNYRGQFAKILKESSYAELVHKLREKAEKKPEKPKAP